MKKVLVVDDSQVYRNVLKQLLTEYGYEVVLAQNGLEAIKILQLEGSPDLVLLDRLMPEMSGDEVCQWVRSNMLNQEGGGYKYTILLTSKISRQDMLEGFDLGADDYLMKPFDPPELKARLEVGVRILKLQRQLWSAATRDFMTGLYNRRAFMNYFSLEIVRAQRENKLLSVAIADVDNFKCVNDTYGHGEGDKVIIEVANRMQNVMRSFDIVGRIGGEEFAIAFAYANCEEAVQVCERIRKSIQEEPFKTTEVSLMVTISIGIALLDDNNMSLEDCLRQADKALYQAKRQGKNQVELLEASPE